MTKELSKAIMNRSKLKNRYTNGRLVKRLGIYEAEEHL